MPGTILVRAGQHREVPWKNGLGVTAELVVEPAGDEWAWRVSAARVDTSGPFSMFPDVDRSLTVFDGAGLTLDVGGRTMVCGHRQTVRFPGDTPTTATLHAGPVRDLNLMVRRGQAEGRVDLLDPSSDPASGFRYLVPLSESTILITPGPDPGVTGADDETLRLATLDLVSVDGEDATIRVVEGCIATVHCRRLGGRH